MFRLVSLLAVLVSAWAFAPPAALPCRRARGLHMSGIEGAECVEEESCSVEELQTLLDEVKSKAAEIKSLEEKLTKLTKDDSAKLKNMIAAEECEMNGFDGCSVWYYDD